VTIPEKDNKTSSVTQDLGKWSTVYHFYYNQTGQYQNSLSISPTGAVVQTQSAPDNRVFYGQAKIITKPNNQVLSYVVNQDYSSGMPSTKMINPDVLIEVTWDNNGGVDDYYGYSLSIGGLALTDGVASGSGVNEAWISSR
jgi:hypothetical protein